MSIAPKNGDGTGISSPESAPEIEELLARLSPERRKAVEHRAKETESRFPQPVSESTRHSILKTAMSEVLHDLGEEARAIVGEEWGPPTPFDAHDELPKFPLEALPSWLRDFVVAVAKAQELPSDIHAMFTLAVLSATVANRVVIDAGGGWLIPPNLYTCIIAEPSVGKTPACQIATEPLLEWEQELVHAAGPSITEAREHIDLLKLEKEKLHADYKKAIDPETKKSIHLQVTDLAERMRALSLKNTTPCLLVDDTTMERLVWTMAANDERAAIISDEGGFLKRMWAVYSQGKESPHVDLYKKSYDGSYYKFQRRQDQVSIPLRTPALTIGVGIQPSALKVFASHPEAWGEGVLARNLYWLIPDADDERTFEERERPHAEILLYRDQVRWLLKLDAEMDDFGHKRAWVIGMDKDARALHRRYQRQLQTRRGLDGDLEDLKQWAVKLDQQVIRIAGLLHCADMAGGDRKPWGVDLPKGTMLRAIAIVDAMIVHALAAFAVMGSDEITERAKRVWRKILRDRKEVIARHELTAYTKNFTGWDTDKTTKMIKRLCALKYLRPLKEEQKGQGERYEVNLSQPGGTR